MKIENDLALNVNVKFHLRANVKLKTRTCDDLCFVCCLIEWCDNEYYMYMYIMNGYYKAYYLFDWLITIIYLRQKNVSTENVAFPITWNVSLRNITGNIVTKLCSVDKKINEQYVKVIDVP